MRAGRAILVVATIATTALTGGAQVVVKFEWLGALSGRDSTATGVNQLGVVTGYYHTSDSASHAFVYDNGQMLDVGAASSYANTKSAGINDTGQLAGLIYLTDGSTHAALYDGSAFNDLGTLGGKNSTAMGINAAGTIVGYSDTASRKIQAYQSVGGALVAVPALGGSTSMAYGINSFGMIVGQSATLAGTTHAFVYDGVNVADLGTMGGSFSVATAIGDSGWITGYSSTPSGGSRAFLYRGAGLEDLGTLGGKSSYGWAINSFGIIAGSSYVTANPPTRAYIEYGGAMLDLNQLSSLYLTPGSSLTTAVSITDNGWVAGSGYCAESQRTEAWRMQILPTLSGHVELGAWRASPNGIPVKMLLSKSGTVIQEIDFALNAAGNYSVPIVAWDTYDVSVKAPHWLSLLETGVNLGQTGSIDWYMDNNGDADGNDAVNFLDLSQVLSDYNSGATRSDMDGDHKVSLPDLATVLSSFGLTGQS